jgi:predicted DNA-binding ArsR family transcriptional regulator
MAISPQKAEKLTLDEQDMINEYETEIDNVLRRGERIFRNFDKAIKQKILDTLKSQYQAAGWDIKINTEGDRCVMIFKKKGSD